MEAAKALIATKDALEADIAALIDVLNSVCDKLVCRYNSIN